MRCILSIVVLLVAPSALFAQPVTSLADGRSGRIEFASMTPSGPGELVRGAGAPATISGMLAVPTGTAARMPAMVIAHGSGGILPGREDAWAARLNKLGIATFVVDSFTPRGLASTARDQSRLSTMANLTDALSALKLLATHPRIDPGRIGVMGFSRGGQVALYSALEPLRRGIVQTDLRFAAHVALYPSCIPYRAREVSRAPILMLLGGADDYTPALACRDYAAWFSAKGAEVRVITYDGAHHDFDIPQAPRFVQSLQSARDCKAEVDVESGTVRRLDTGEILRDQSSISAYFRACMQRGATMGGDPAALTRAERDVAAFLGETLRPLR